LYRAALGSGRAVIREVFSTADFWDDVRAHGCTWTLLYAAPTRFLLSQCERVDDGDNPLELVMLCPLVPEVDVLKKRFGVECFTVYGLTEIANPFILPPAESHAGNAGSGGRPIPGVQARLVDENDYEVPEGEPGELIVRSDEPWIFSSGYQGDPAATATAWRNGWFHSGDIMRRDADGNYHYLDRRKDMIRRRGENVSSFEVEAAVMKFPDVAEVAAVGIPAAVGDEEVLIALVPKPGAQIDRIQLMNFLRANMPRFAMPRYVRQMTALPRTPATQRVQKKDIRDTGVTADTWDTTLPAASVAPHARDFQTETLP
jgi:crotonobetaine/carnitine-CoA ligase